MQKKRGQVTLFIIIALVIVVLGVLIYLFWPKLNISSEFDAKNPELFIKSCVREDLENIVYDISMQGGELNPDFSYFYGGWNLTYLCYSAEYFQFCSVQIPLLKKHIQSEIDSAIKPTVDDCFNQLIAKYQEKGYLANYKKGTVITNLLPERIVSTFYNYNATISKGENTEKYNSFNIVLNNNLYELVSIADSIIEEESTFGTADNIDYMLLYNNLNITKIPRVDDTTIYIIKNKITKNTFQFASRSYAIPPGY